MSVEPTPDQVWHALLNGQYDWIKERKRYGLFPARHRCKNCNAPFDGIGKWYARLTGRGQFSRNPRFCNYWMEFCHKYPGGTELEISMLFVDVRGSTKLAEGMRAAEFSRLMNRFYQEATGVLINTNAFIDKFVGDEVIGLYFPLFAGNDHAGMAVRAAQELLRVNTQADKAHQALPIGIGVHTGVAYVGTVSGTEGSIRDITALGENVNITARLASQAGVGEALISEAAYHAAGHDLANAEQRHLYSVVVFVSASVVEPRTSANSNDSTASAPASSSRMVRSHLLHSLGLKLDGCVSVSQLPSPDKGRLHSKQRTVPILVKDSSPYDKWCT